NPHLGRNTLDDIQVTSFYNSFTTEATVVFTYDFNSATPGDFISVGFDSGSPTFVPQNGLLTLLGTHYAVGPTLSADSALPVYINQPNPFMALDRDPTHPNGYALQIIPNPEPGSLFLTAVAVAGGAVWQRRRRAARA